jgi:undecaprenyl phosphate N,N'-diacetylbacillosamine 1-phosphate transferase
MYQRYFKRLFDIVVSLTAILVLAPLFIIVALLVRINLGSPVIFKDDRPGKDEKIFTMYKFRTMSNARDINGELLPDSQRLNNFGRILRSTSLDELPELFNVLKGDMSLVGPRPLAVKYLPYYNELQRKRHSVLPGITGLAQVNGRNTIMWETRFNYDIQYVENISFVKDMQILLLTIINVLQCRDIGSRKESDADMGIEDFDLYCIRNNLVEIKQPPDQKQSGEMQGLSH